MAGPTLEQQLSSLSQPKPPDWTSVLGIPGQSVPSSMDDIGQLAKDFGAVPTVPTAPQYLSTPGMKTPNYHPPIMGQTNAPTNRQGITNQATSTIQARRQNRFANISNAINTATNAYKQRKDENLRADITNLTKAQIQIDNANQVIADPNASTESKNAAKQVLADNTKQRDALLNDDKKRKEFAKAFDITFTDPSKLTDENKIASSAVAGAQKEAQQGYAPDNKNEKIVQDASGQSVPGTIAPQTPQQRPGMGRLQVGSDQLQLSGRAPVAQPAPAARPAAQPQQPQMNAQQMAKIISSIPNQPPKPQGPSYGQQFSSAMPHELQANPLYEAQLKQYEAQQKYATQYLLPKLIDQRTKQITTAQLNDEHLRATYIAATQRIYDAQMSNLTGDQKALIERDSHLKGVAMQNAQSGKNAQLRAQTALQLGGLMDSKGNYNATAMGWKAEAAKNQALMSFTTELSRIEISDKVMTDQNDAIHIKYPKGDIPPSEQETLNSNETALAMDAGAKQQLTDNRQKMMTMMYGQPVKPDAANDKGAMEPYYAPGQPKPAGKQDATKPSSSTGGFGISNTPGFQGLPVPTYNPISSAKPSVNGKLDDSAAQWQAIKDLDYNTIDRDRAEGEAFLNEQDTDSEENTRYEPDREAQYNPAEAPRPE
jgi:hypothetical protein